MPDPPFGMRPALRCMSFRLLSQICDRLNKEGILKRSGRPGWDPTAVWDVLREPAYKGRRFTASRVSASTGRDCDPHMVCHRVPRRPRSIVHTDAAEQIVIPVPAIVTPELFDAVQEKLADNRSRKRRGELGVRFLLQGLTVCSKCGYAYLGHMQNKLKENHEARSYGYYFCTGADRFRWGGDRICPNRPVRMERLDATVWERHQTAAPSLVSSQPDAQNRLLLCLVPTMSHAGMDLVRRFDRARNLTPGLPPSSLAV